MWHQVEVQQFGGARILYSTILWLASLYKTILFDHDHSVSNNLVSDHYIPDHSVLEIAVLELSVLDHYVSNDSCVG